MKIDTGFGGSWHRIPEAIKQAEAEGYDGINVAETGHNPFLPLMVAAEHSSKIELKTSIAVAFARSPMDMAYIAHDLNSYSKGRFILGLGSQIKAHIEKRFSMPWSAPAARMREYIEAMRAIWDAWHEGKRLEFRGKLYTHVIMTPFFTPTDIEYGRPRIFLAAVGPLMTRVAAEVCDGILLHGFTTEKYIKEVTLPAIEAGLTKAGRERKDFEIVYSGFNVTGRNEEEFQRTKVATMRQIAFYGSTPAYKGVLDLHGWGDLQPELNRMSKQGRWEEMGELIGDDVLRAFARVGGPAECVDRFIDSFKGIVDRTGFGFVGADADQHRELIGKLRAA